MRLGPTDAEGNRKLAILRTCALIWASATIASAAGGAPKPDLHSDPISFGDERKSQMARYSDRHYGEREWRLDDPKVIVLHYTATDSYSAVWNTFDANTPTLGEPPGTCAHYVIEQNGTINELVAPRIRCRHTIGLNHTSIGIELVQAAGSSPHSAEQQILDRRKQVGAALRLVRWLQGRYDIPTNEVIGHAMANHDRYFKDLQGWVNDHTDWPKRDVRKFRDRL